MLARTYRLMVASAELAEPLRSRLADLLHYVVASLLRDDFADVVLLTGLKMHDLMHHFISDVAGTGTHVRKNQQARLQSSSKRLLLGRAEAAC